MRREASKTNKNIKIEVNTNHTSRQTGNYLREFSPYGKALSIATTEADYYVIHDTAHYYLVSVEYIGQILRIMDVADELE